MTLFHPFDVAKDRALRSEVLILPVLIAALALHSGTCPARSIADPNLAPIGPADLQAYAVLSSPITCHGGLARVNVSATGGTAPYSNTGMTLHKAGTHTFTITDALRRTASVSITIPEPDPFFATSSIVSMETSCGAGDAVVKVVATGGTEAKKTVAVTFRPTGLRTLAAELNKRQMGAA